MVRCFPLEKQKHEFRALAKTGKNMNLRKKTTRHSSKKKHYIISIIEKSNVLDDFAVRKSEGIRRSCAIRWKQKKKLYEIGLTTCLYLCTEQMALFDYTAESSRRHKRNNFSYQCPYQQFQSPSLKLRSSLGESCSERTLCTSPAPLKFCRLNEVDPFS